MILAEVEAEDTTLELEDILEPRVEEEVLLVGDNVLLDVEFLGGSEPFGFDIGCLGRELMSPSTSLSATDRKFRSPP